MFGSNTSFEETRKHNEQTTKTKLILFEEFDDFLKTEVAFVMPDREPKMASVNCCKTQKNGDA